jgi:hypothetical protein
VPLDRRTDIPPSAPHADPPPRLDRGTISLLVLALVLGSVLRFADLGTRELSADEGASWAAASAATASAVLRAQSHLNPGKAGVHDLILHEWINLFGDSVGAMRALSAAAGTLVIVLVFFVTRELLALDRGSPDAVAVHDGEIERPRVAAIAALLVAVNLITIKYSREARMYPLMLAAILAQTFFFLRASRVGSAWNYAAVAIFTAVAVATHLTAMVFVAVEALWLLGVALAYRSDRRAPQFRRTVALAASLALAMAGLTPVIPGLVRGSANAVAIGAIDWIKAPPLWAPLSLFDKAIGSFAFPPLAALWAWGLYRGWRRVPLATRFALLWMWAPPLILMLVSWLLHPVFLERYLLSSFVPFLFLAALGISELRPASLQLGLLALVVVLALIHVAGWQRKPHDAQWREAAAAALPYAQGGPIAVAPGFAVNVVRYYVRTGQGAPAAESFEHAGDAPVLIIGDGADPTKAAVLAREFPRPLAYLRGVVVRGR